MAVAVDAEALEAEETVEVSVVAEVVVVVAMVVATVAAVVEEEDHHHARATGFATGTWNP